MMNVQTPSPSSSTYQPQQQIQPVPQYTASEQQQEQVKCPRCDSNNTKFCYYNNYNLSQPRHYCKDCKRYWTKGGALRNIPIGGGSRKTTKRSSNPIKKSSPSSSGLKPDHSSIIGSPVDHNHDHGSMMDVNGSFISLLAGFNQHGPGTGLDLENYSESFLDLHSGGDSTCWNNGGGGDGGGDNGWPDLAI